MTRALRALACAIVILGGLPSLAAGAILHVDQNNGNCTNSGSGTQQQPFCTIGAAATQVAAGGTVLVQPGTYNEEVVVPTSGTPGAPIVFEAAGAVTVTGQTRGFDLSGRSWITVRGFTITNTTLEGIRALLVENLTISGNQVINADDVGIEVRDCGDVSISDNLVRGSNADGIYVKFCDAVTVTGNEVTESGQPVSGEVQKGIQLNGSANSLVSDNLTEANSDHGIYVAGSSTAILIKGNVSRSNARQYTRAATGMEVRGSSGNTVEGNTVYDNEDSGMNIRSGSNNNTVVNNLSYDNGDHGIDHLDASNGRIIGNTVYGNFKHGLEIEGGSVGITIANNIAGDNGLTTSEANIRTSANSVSGSTADYNLVFGGGVLYTWGDAHFSSLDDLRSAYPGLEAHGIEGDPLWVAPGSGNFQLSAGSPAIDSANSGASGALDHDLDGNTRADDPGTVNTGTGPRAFDDRGAFEFGGTSPPNNPPEIISGPTATPNPVASDATAQLTVSATDPDNDPLDYAWSVLSGDGIIEGAGSTVTYVPPAVLEPEVHTIEVEVSDDRGGFASNSVDLTVEPSNNTPPSITSGPDAVPNPVFSDESAELTVDAQDADGDPLEYAWSVPPGGGSINGAGSTVTYLPPAVADTQIYPITVEVSDGRGGLATGAVEVTVEPSPLANLVSFRPVADAWVNETSPTQNNGGANRLNVDGGSIDSAFLRFDVGGLAAPVRGAWIELEVFKASSDGGTIYSVPDNSWGEFTITYNNQPAVGSALDTSGPVSVGDILQLDVTAAINQDGQYSFAILGDGKDGWSVRSREGSANTPMLFIETEPTS